MFEMTEKVLTGYKLINMGDKYRLISSTNTYTGSLKEVCRYAVNDLGFSINEIELGVMKMEENFHNISEFGVLKRFLYTYDQIGILH